jgi:hypothetical protein
MLVDDLIRFLTLMRESRGNIPVKSTSCFNVFSIENVVYCPNGPFDAIYKEPQEFNEELDTTSKECIYIF